MDEVHRPLSPLQYTQQPDVLTHPFPTQPSLPPQGGNGGLFFNPTISSAVFMCKEDVNVTTRAKPYDVPNSSSSLKDSLAPLTSIVLLMLDNYVETVCLPPRVSSARQHTILLPGLLSATILLKTLPRPLMPCLPWRFCKSVLSSTRPCCP